MAWIAAADAASTEVPLPPAKATDELTDAERLFQGVWELASHGSGSSTGTLRIDQRDFHADVIHGEYSGYVTIRADTSPTQIDFTIQGCECKFEGMASKGIYSEEDDGAIVFVAPPPGEPRPEAFTGLDDTKFMIERATRVAEGDGK